MISNGVTIRCGVIASIVIVAFTLIGCSDLGRPVALEARGEISATTLDFGTIAVHDSASRTVTLRNSGNADLTGDVSISCPGFRIVSGGGPFTLVPGGVLDIVLRFAPQSEGTFSCVVELGGANPRVTVAGAAAVVTPGAECVVRPNSIDFGIVSAGQSLARTFKIFSVGTAPVQVNVVSTCNAYLPVSGGGPATIPPGDSLSVNVLFNPLGGGGFPCTIVLGPGCPSVSVAGFATTVSYTRDVAGIFVRQGCSNCHGGNGQLFLTPDVSYAQLVNVRSFGYPVALRIKPFEPDSSVLYGKITGNGRFGSQMVPTTQAQRDKIRAWIVEGALNN